MAHPDTGFRIGAADGSRMTDVDFSRIVAPWRRLQLGQKAALGLVVACVPLVVMGLQVSAIARDELRAQTLQSVELASRLGSERVGTAYADLEDRVDDLALGAEFRSVVADHAEQPSDATRQRFADIAGDLSLGLEADGLEGVAVFERGQPTPLAADGTLAPTTTSIALRADAPDGVVVIGDAFVENGVAKLPVIRRVSVDGSRSVELVSQWRLDVVVPADDLDGLGRTARSELFAFQADGRIQVLRSDDPARVGQAESPGPLPSAGSIEIDDETELVVALATVDGPGWLHRTAIERSELYGEIDGVRSALIAVFVGAGLVVLVAVAFLFRSFARRLGRVTAVAESIATGDLTVRIGDDQADEVGRLSAAFDTMAESLAEDIERRERVEQQLAFQATHDALTGLPNRVALTTHLDALVADSANHPVSVCFVDLDGFKGVNDQLGHAAGDELLSRAARRLSDVTRTHDYVARLGGDEFVLVFPKTGGGEAGAMAERIVAALELPFEVAESEVAISASIGVADASDPTEADELIRQADIAMYRAKALGKGQAAIVDPDTLRQLDERLTLSAQLREALIADRLELAYHPIVELGTKRLVAVEADVQWRHPERGVISGDEFTDFLDQAGLSALVDEWVVRSAISEWSDLITEGFAIDDLELAVNLSNRSFLTPKVRQVVRQALQRGEVSADRVRIEVDETVLRSNRDGLADAFAGFRGLGVNVIIDRFGSDYSNLDRLRRLAIDGVKLAAGADGLADRDDLPGRALVGSLATLADAAGLRVGATGIDRSSVRDRLLELGCHEGQGSWLSEPLSRRQLERLVESRHLLEA